eukprot:c3941_g1_i1 orf=103-1077(+)
MSSHGGVPAEGGGIETCARLMMGSPPSPLFIKGSWFPHHFLLSITDGLHCWTCQATEQAVAERAAGWDESITEYLQRAQFYLSHQHPESSYAFVADGEHRKLSWTMEKHGTKLEGKWKCEKAKDDRQITCSILNFLMDSNVKLSDEVLRKTQSFERMKGEAEKCLKQSEQFKNEKQQFEVDVFRKFVAVLNSKKSKLRELRDKLARFEPSNQNGNEEETDDEESEQDDSGSGDDEGSNGAREQENAGEVSHGMYDTHKSTAAAAPELSDTKPDIHTAGSPRGQAYVGTSQVQKSPGSTSGVVDSAAALLADSAYTSAPKRRRRL